MHGGPVWDDVSYLFNHPSITGETSYFEILKNFAWPVSVMSQKFIYGIFGTKYFFYHLLNVFIHFINALLILKIAEKMKLPFPRPLFLLFLLHPSSVIAVSWIIQFKTLLCFLFALLSSYFFLSQRECKTKYLLSLFFFILSLLSKSASITLPLVFTLILWKKTDRRQLLWIIPFYLVSCFGAWRILKSPVTQGALTRLEKNSTPAISSETNSQIPQTKTAPPELKITSPVPQESAKASSSPKTIPPAKFAEKWNTFQGTFHYYFWQTLLPLDNEPVKGKSHLSSGIQLYLHLFFILILIIINWARPPLFFLLSGYLLCVPFLGIFPAPYMNLTWVSDQHLYLALPFFISFWLSLLYRIKNKFIPYIPYALLPAYCFLVFTTSAYYKNEITFYEASLKYDATNIPIAYNLAVAYLQRGEFNQALNVTTSTVQMAQLIPELLKNEYFIYLYILHLNLQDKSKKES